MTKIEHIIYHKMVNKVSAKLYNTQIKFYDDGFDLWLFDNLIATKRDNILTLDSCGWQTKTTVSRFNVILEALNLPFLVYRKNNTIHFAVRYSDNIVGKSKIIIDIKNYH